MASVEPLPIEYPENTGGPIRVIRCETIVRKETRIRCEMESERTLRVDWNRPHQPPPPGGRPIVGPAIIPTVSSPLPFGAYLSDAERFRHIDSSVGSTITGNSRAGLAEVESLGDEEMVRETAVPVQIEARESGAKEVEGETPGGATQVPAPATVEAQRPEPRRR